MAPDRIGFAGQKSFIHFQEAGFKDRAVRDDGLAAGQADVIAQDDGTGGNFQGPAVAQDLDPGFHENGQLIEMVFGTQLLRQAKDGIDDGHAADGDAPLIFSQDKQGAGRRRHHGVEPGTHIAANDVEVIRGQPEPR